VYEGFFSNIKEQYPDLTTGDMRLAAIMKLKLSQSEIAAMMGISEDSVKKAKQRLKAKLSSHPDFKLKNWVETLS
jgi:DNA-binding CsgD family transcriptional regulator